MRTRTLTVLACTLLLAAASTAQASERNRSWCRHLANSNDPMVWGEGFGVGTCNDRAATPYQPWYSAVPVRKNRNDPMVARDDWRVNGFSAYDHSYDDHYDRRWRRYR